jgi:seryl-tRNA synthetase
MQVRTQELQARRNSASKQIGIAKSKGEDASALMAEVAHGRTS